MGLRADDVEHDQRRIDDRRPAVDNEGVGYPTHHPDDGEGVRFIIGEVDGECDQVGDSFPREPASAGTVSRVLLYGKRKLGRCRFRHLNFKLG